MTRTYRGTVLRTFPDHIQVKVPVLGTYWHDTKDFFAADDEVWVEVSTEGSEHVVSVTRVSDYQWMLSPARRSLLAELIRAELWRLASEIRDVKKLAGPCPPGFWRWAPDPTPEQAQQYRDREAEAVKRRDSLTAMLSELES